MGHRVRPDFNQPVARQKGRLLRRQSTSGFQGFGTSSRPGAQFRHEPPPSGLTHGPQKPKEIEIHPMTRRGLLLPPPAPASVAASVFHAVFGCLTERPPVDAFSDFDLEETRQLSRRQENVSELIP